MKLVTRKKGSQRTSRPVDVSIYPNWAGEGNARLTFETPDAYLMFEPESDEEARKLMSAVAIAYHNFPGRVL